MSGNGNTSERRQVSVMFCDIVQSTAMSYSLDPEDLWAVMHRYRETVRRTVGAFGGIICHHKGDGILCCFGYPASHEDNASRAVMAALGVLAQLKRGDGAQSGGASPIRLRIGIATGEVAIVDNRAADPDGLELLGPAPNLAARLQTEAEENAALVDEATYRLTCDDFRFTAGRQTQMRGFPVPVTAYRPLAAEDAPTRFERARTKPMSAFVNRQHELAEMNFAWQKTCERDGQSLILTGDPGIGKSRLVSHFLKRLADVGHQVIKFQCSALHTRTALHPFAAGLQDFIGLKKGSSDEAKVRHLRAFLQDLGIRDGYSVPLLANLVDLPAAQYLPLLSALKPEEVRIRTTMLVIHCLNALTLRHPLILVAEDLHWADPTTLLLLNDIALSLGNKQMMLIATCRPSAAWNEKDPLRDLYTNANCRVLALDRLSRPHSVEVASDIALRTDPSGLSADWIMRIVERSDGVPLFIEELTRAVMDRGDTNESEQASRHPPSADTGAGKPPSPTADTDIPATLRDSLTARLDSLRHASPGSFSPKRVAEIGACIGREFPIDMLARVVTAEMAAELRPACETGPEVLSLLKQALTKLADADLVHRVNETAGDDTKTADVSMGDIANENAEAVAQSASAPTYRFKHALVQDAAYAGLWRRDKRQIHAWLLTILQEGQAAGGRGVRPELLAHHACAAGDMEAAARNWLRAGLHATRRSSLKEARIDFEEVLRLAEKISAPETRAGVQLEGLMALGAALMAEKGFAAPEVERVFDRAGKIARRLGREHELFLPTQLGRHINLMARGRHRQAARLGRECVSLARQHGRVQFELEALRHLGISLFCLGQPEEACEYLSRVMPLYTPSRHGELPIIYGSDPRSGALAFLSLAQAMLGLTRSARETSWLSVRVAMEVNHPHSMANTLVCRATLLDILEAEEAHEAAEQANTFSMERGLPFWGYWAQVLEGHALIRRGEVDAGLRLAEEGMAAFSGTGATAVHPYLCSIIAHGHRMRGDLKTAIAHQEDAIYLAGANHEGAFESELWRVHALMKAELTGSDPETETSLMRALKRSRKRNMYLFEARTARDLGAWLLARERISEARRIVGQSLEHCQGMEDKASLSALEEIFTRIDAASTN
ncbi:AAA family ATPase [Breoghania sp.]|uniref:ATP-binding protein n=1 Tax=Breoghania sp. TaxID=2065378 RepID=UPI002AA6994A|nr:AAA family ATPase [Breoghania sp.]